MRITLKQLQIFAAIAQEGNMSIAAKNLYLSQSACSMALRTLEDQLSGELFERRGKHLVLNERGNRFFPDAINVLKEMEILEEKTRVQTPSTHLGKMTVGASSTIGNYMLPPLLQPFLAKYPDTDFSLRIDNTEEVIEALCKFTIDIGFIEGSCHASRVEVNPWKKDELIVIASPHHPLAKKKKITETDLHQAKWILRESGSGTREKLENVMQGKVQHFFEFGRTEAIKQAVALGMGISCVSRATVKDAMKTKALIELKTPFLQLSRDLYWVLHQDKRRSEAVNLLLKNVL